MALHIRKFRESDAKEASEMLLGAFQWFHKWNKRSWLWKSLQPSMLIANSKTQDILVAEKANNIVGYISSTTTPFQVAYIPTVGIASHMQNVGIGTLLLNRKLRYLRRQKVRKVWLLVTSSNVRAITFYLKHKFVIEGYLRDHTGPGSDEVLLSKFL